jgi:DNA invertase Pin-like site-specific DNA recombinase
MDESAERLLKNFIDAANKQTPHATDWRRFYDFLIAVHRQGLDASEGEVGNMIWAARFLILPISSRPYLRVASTCSSVSRKQDHPNDRRHLRPQEHGEDLTMATKGAGSLDRPTYPPLATTNGHTPAVLVGIYVRKSTKQEHADSVARQEALCRELATARGWLVDDTYVFRDDGVSGAEFDTRPDLRALREILGRRPVPFGLLLVTNKDRLGRENYETGYLLKQLAVAGVQVVEQKTGRAIALATPTDRLQVQVGNYAAEVERDQEGQRTHQALRLKAQAGHVTGGCVFGYLNEDVYPERRAPRKVRHEAGEDLA